MHSCHDSHSHRLYKMLQRRSVDSLEFLRMTGLKIIEIGGIKP